MPILRQALLGSPHCYLVANRCATGAALLRGIRLQSEFLATVELVRRVFRCRIHAGRIGTSGYALVLRHSADAADDDDTLRTRWSELGIRSCPPPERLRARLTSLPGFMQTLGQRASRVVNRHRRSRGHVWEARYRACLLGDDAALLAACAWLEHHPEHGSHWLTPEGTVRLSPPPVIAQPDGTPLPTDEAPLGQPPSDAATAWRLWRRYAAGFSPTDLAAYDAALTSGWCLGRPESLTEALHRLGRHQGRGRARQLRELDDALGLCGVWG